MHLRLTVETGGEAHHVSLSCDVTTTVGDLARALIRSGLTGNAELERVAAGRLAPLTLIGRADAAAPRVMLDPAAPLAHSGVQSGWTVEAADEFAGRDELPRLIPVAGTVEVCDGPQRGARFSLIAGENTIGRDPRNRIVLDEPSVSRLHAVLEIGGECRVRDLGSANGLSVDGAAVREAVLQGETEVRLGSVGVRVRLDRPPAAPPALSHVHAHTRPPRLEARFPETQRRLPEPPPARTRGRIPLIAMLAPMLLGGAVFAVTGAPMSLLMIAFTPLMMLGSWLDGSVLGRRAFLRGSREFEAALVREREHLRELGSRERETRSAESPTARELAAAIVGRDPLLWARRPELPGFLEVRLGEGALPSRTEVVLPERGRSATGHWESLGTLQAEFAEVDRVPVLDALGGCGSLGIAGDAIWGQGLARSVVMQLAALHSPAELEIACIAGPSHLGGASDWGWLTWLPHVSPASGTLGVWPLAGDPVSATEVISALEAVLAARQARGVSAPARPAIVVVVLEAPGSLAARLIELGERGAELGIHLVWVAGRVADVPAVCRTFIEIDRGAARVGFVREARAVQLASVEFMEEPVALALARRLAAVTDTALRELDDSDLPREVSLGRLHEEDILGGPGRILARWRHSGSLQCEWPAGVQRDQIRLAAVVGQGAAGVIELDLRAQGPHALVAGTTGSGKSELLQTWIMALAAEVSPERVTFLLVDYKGGAAFAECTELPHTVGLVTDLDTHLVRRVLRSLRAELHHRERVLARHGAKDLITMERSANPDAPPALVIVIDEFAALVSEVPEFVEGVIDIAQRGRSLGLHLVLATQRPAGTITEKIRANTRLRIALRVADAADSSDVVGVPDAAFLDPTAPGRAVLTTSAAGVTHFQSAYLGGEEARADSAASSIELRTLAFGRAEPWLLPPEPRAGRREGRRDIERLRTGIRLAAEAVGLAAPRRPWLDPLPHTIDLAALVGAGGSGAEGGDANGGASDGDGDDADADAGAGTDGAGGDARARGGASVDSVASADAGASVDAVVIGLRDLPDAQLQVPLEIDFEQIGNLAILGASGTGKSCALVTLAAALSERAAEHPVQLYAVDAAGGALDALTALPTVGGVASAHDPELMGRVLAHVRDTMAERASRFSAARCSSLAAYRRTPAGAQEPRIVLLIDGLTAFRAAAEAASASCASLLSEIMGAGRAVGVHVVLTADRVAALPAAMGASVQQQIVLRLAAALDYGFLGLPPEAHANAGPGRALVVPGGDEVQLAVVGGSADSRGQAAALRGLAATLGERDVARAPLVRNAPERVALAGLPLGAGSLPALGIDTRTLHPFGVARSGLAVIAGPPGSGMTTAAVSCATAVARWAAAHGERVETILLTLERAAAARPVRWDRVERGAEAVAAAARELADRLSAEAPGDQAGGCAVIVVERAAEAEGSAALPALVELARAARRARSLVVFEFELGAAAGVWELLTELKRAGWGIALQPDEGDSGTPFRSEFGRVRREHFPPGRGFLVHRGRATPVQVAESWGSLED